MRLEIGDRTLLCTHHMRVYAHHTHSRLDFDTEIAQMAQHPHDSTRWGLKNTSSTEWTLLTADGKRIQVPVGRSVPLKHGLTIQFGSAEGILLSK